ncbi:MAG: hypothetical protein ACOYY2_02955 [Actinomycetota bacterium]
MSTCPCRQCLVLRSHNAMRASRGLPPVRCATLGHQAPPPASRPAEPPAALYLLLPPPSRPRCVHCREEM